MKKLTYSSALLLLFLSIAACTKNGDLLPVTRVPNPKPVPPAACDSTKLVSYALNNLTGTGSFNVLFSGSNNYVFSISANANTTVAVKPGIYSITVYAPGNISEYDDYVEYSSHRLLIKESGARIDNVIITPCTGPQSLGIAE